jgi:hypothetical protein
MLSTTLALTSLIVVPIAQYAGTTSVTSPGSGSAVQALKVSVNLIDAVSGKYEQDRIPTKMCLYFTACKRSSMVQLSAEEPLSSVNASSEEDESSSEVKSLLQILSETERTIAKASTQFKEGHLTLKALRYQRSYIIVLLKQGKINLASPLDHEQSLSSYALAPNVELLLSMLVETEQAILYAAEELISEHPVIENLRSRRSDLIMLLKQEKIDLITLLDNDEPLSPGVESLLQVLSSTENEIAKQSTQLTDEHPAMEYLRSKQGELIMLLKQKGIDLH